MSTIDPLEEVRGKEVIPSEEGVSPTGAPLAPRLLSNDQIHNVLTLLEDLAVRGNGNGIARVAVQSLSGKSPIDQRKIINVFAHDIGDVLRAIDAGIRFTKMGEARRALRGQYMSIPVIVDTKIQPDTIKAVSDDGKVLGEIVNIGVDVAKGKDETVVVEMDQG